MADTKVIDKTDENGEVYAVLSRRRVQEDCMRDYISTLVPGCVIDAVVTHMESFGVFADIGAGISALILRSDPSVFWHDCFCEKKRTLQ